MAAVKRDEGRFEVDASVIAEGFGLDPAIVAGLMREGRITSRCETGVADDAGRWRLTFYHQGRALRLTVDAAGRVISRARFATPRRG